MGPGYSVFEATFRRAGVVMSSLRTGGSVDPSTEDTRTKKGTLSRDDGTNEYVNWSITASASPPSSPGFSCC